MSSEKTMMKMFSVLSQVCGASGWHISGPSLLEFIKTGDIKTFFTVTIIGNCKQVIEKLGSDGYHDSSSTVSMGDAVLTLSVDVFSEKDIDREFISGFQRNKLNFPIEVGKHLDEISKWWEVSSDRIRDEKSCFFTKDRLKEAHYQIKVMQECARRVGILEKMFLGFGGCLGLAIYNDFLPNDNDIDICFLPIPDEARRAYFDELKKEGLCEGRMHGPNYLNGEMVWVSVGRKSPYGSNHGVKACNWFWFNHGGSWWHTKGKDWIGKSKANKNRVASKGIPESVFSGKLVMAKFGSSEIQIPANLGKCLDWWYPNWIFREQVSSALSMLLIHPDEADKKTWFIERK